MEHRQGASFDYILKSPFLNADGTVFDLTDSTLTSSIRHLPTGNLIDCGTIGKTQVDDEWYLTFNAAGNLTDTSDWALGNVEQDLRLTTADGKNYYVPVWRFRIVGGPTA